MLFRFEAMDCEEIFANFTVGVCGFNVQAGKRMSESISFKFIFEAFMKLLSLELFSVETFYFNSILICLDYFRNSRNFSRTENYSRAIHFLDKVHLVGQFLHKFVTNIK